MSYETYRPVGLIGLKGSMGLIRLSSYFCQQMRFSFLLLFLGLFFTNASFAQKPRGLPPRPVPRSSTLFMYLESYRTVDDKMLPTDSALLIPIAVVSEGKLSEPEPEKLIGTKADLPFQKKFIEEHYAHAPLYAITDHGVIVDTLRQIRATADASDEVRLYLQATVHHSESITFDPFLPKLAGSPALFHTGAARSREANPVERAEILKTCYDLFRAKGLNLTSTDTLIQQQILISNISKESDDRAIVYLFTKADSNGSEYALSLVMRKEGDHFATEYKQLTMPTDSSVYPGFFVGQSDLDHDGIDELVFQISDGEFQGVAVMKLVGDSWKKIYEYYYGG